MCFCVCGVPQLLLFFFLVTRNGKILGREHAKKLETTMMRRTIPCSDRETEAECKKGMIPKCTWSDIYKCFKSGHPPKLKKVRKSSYKAPSATNAEKAEIGGTFVQNLTN